MRTQHGIRAGCCSSSEVCGLQGIFSNYGTYPDWSPYQGFVVSEAITFNQNNVFSNNRYCGDWHFMVHDQGSVIDFPAWQAAPYGQDAGSQFICDDVIFAKGFE